MEKLTLEYSLPHLIQTLSSNKAAFQLNHESPTLVSTNVVGPGTQRIWAPDNTTIRTQDEMKNVLLVEDNIDDVVLMKLACQRTGIPLSLHIANDGQEAIDYLLGTGIYADRNLYPVPDLVFLDINMPRRNGHEVLEWVRSQPSLCNLPVVVMSSSTRTEDVERAYELGVTSYLQKIASPAEFGQGVRVILKYWLELNIPSNFGYLSIDSGPFVG